MVIDPFQDPPAGPFEWCSSWIEEACQRSNLPNPNAMALATLSSEGIPEVRMVLLKGFDQFGPRFFTHYESPKGQSIESNKNVALVMHWDELDRQLRMVGKAFKLDSKDSDAYFNSRSRLSRIGAIVSKQSEELGSFKEFRIEVEEMDAQAAEKIVRPDTWGGYRVELSQVEFWQGHEGRLHQRVQYEFIDKKEGWSWKYLYP